MFDAPTLLTEEDLVVDLAARCSKRGDQGRVAKALGVGQCEVSAVINGLRPLRPGLASALGYRPVIRFEPIKP
jgi:plasmid maintenance system antidote protein VapI